MYNCISFQKYRLKNSFSKWAEIYGWMQIAFSPTLIGIGAGIWIYLSHPATWSLIIAILVAIVGLAIGIIWATRVWKTKGTIWFTSRIMASKELDKTEADS